MELKCLHCGGADARTKLACHFCTGCFVDLTQPEKQAALERWEALMARESEAVEGYERPKAA